MLPDPSSKKMQDSKVLMKMVHKNIQPLCQQWLRRGRSPIAKEEFVEILEILRERRTTPTAECMIQVLRGINMSVEEFVAGFAERLLDEWEVWTIQIQNFAMIQQDMHGVSCMAGSLAFLENEERGDVQHAQMSCYVLSGTAKVLRRQPSPRGLIARVKSHAFRVKPARFVLFIRWRKCLVKSSPQETVSLRGFKKCSKE